MLPSFSILQKQVAPGGRALLPLSQARSLSMNTGWGGEGGIRLFFLLFFGGGGLARHVLCCPCKGGPNSRDGSEGLMGPSRDHPMATERRRAPSPRARAGSWHLLRPSGRLEPTACRQGPPCWHSCNTPPRRSTHQSYVFSIKRKPVPTPYPPATGCQGGRSLQ